MNPVIQAQQNIARTLERGLTRLGDRPLRKAEFGLREAALMHEINRQKKLDELAERSFDLEEQQARHELPWQQESDKRAGELHGLDVKKRQFDIENAAKQAQRNQYIFEKQKAGLLFNEQTAKRALQIAEEQGELRRQHITGRGIAPFLFGGQISRETLTDILAQRKMQEIANLTKSKIVKDGEYTKFLKQNNQLATWEDMHKFLPIIEDVAYVTADLGHRLDQKIRQYEKIRSQPGAPMTPESEEWYIQAKKNQKNPQWLIDQYNKQIDFAVKKAEIYRARGMDPTVFIDRIARNKEKVKNLESKRTAAAGAALKIDLENIKAAAQKGAKTGWAEFLYEVNKDESGKPTISKADAANIVRSDESYNARLKAAAAEFKAREMEIMTATDSAAQMAIIKEIRDTYNLVPQAVGKGANLNPDKLDIDMDAYNTLMK